jgi:hypothetical protein
MGLVDHSLTCAECGRRFPWTIQEQRGSGPQDRALPTTCPACRTVLGRIRRWQHDPERPLDQQHILRWLRDEGFLPAAVSQLQTDRQRNRFQVLLREVQGTRSVGLVLDPWEALLVALWLDSDSHAPPRPEAGGVLPSPPALAVLLEAVLVAPGGRQTYQRVVSIITPRACRRVSRVAALGWILQAHTPLWVDQRLFPKQKRRERPWRPAADSPLYSFVSQLGVLDDV